MAIEQTTVEPDLRPRHRRSRELTSLLWVCGWGGVTAVALLILAFTSRTETANERLRRIFASNESSAIARMPPRISQLESDTQLLAAQVRALIVERDRLAGRIALLESSIDDMTGAIKKQAAATAAALAAKATPPVSGATATAPTASLNPPAAIAVPTVTYTLPKSDIPSTQPVPLPPARVAALPANEAEPQVSKPAEFGLDLGGGLTVDAIRQRWATVKANFGPLLSGMHPLAAREHRPGSTGYRLVVGPLPNSVAAAGLCTHFSAARTPCRAVKFDGEQITQQ